MVIKLARLEFVSRGVRRRRRGGPVVPTATPAPPAPAFVSGTTTLLVAHGVDRTRIRRDAFHGHAHSD
jgi:hypothetical protein